MAQAYLEVVDEDLMDVGLAGEGLAGEGLIGEGPLGEDDLEAESLVDCALAEDLVLCLCVVVEAVDVDVVDVGVAAAPEIDCEDIDSEGKHCLFPLAERAENSPSRVSSLSRAPECRRLAVGPVGNKRSARCVHMTSSCDDDPWISSEIFSLMMMMISHGKMGFETSW